MKKILILSVLFMNMCAVAQIKVLETKPLEKVSKLNQNNDIYVQKEGNEYTFFYRNLETKETGGYRTFVFKDLENDFEKLHSIIANGFNATPLVDIKLELPNDYLWLHYTRNTQKVMVQFMTSNKLTSTTGISDILTVEQVNKLFNK